MSERESVEIQIPPLDLMYCSVEEHCRSLLRIKNLSFWWYIGVNKTWGNFSIPFQDREGRWWYQVKPGFCWPVDLYVPVDKQSISLSFRKTFIGYQCPINNASYSNSSMTINTLRNLTQYGIHSVSKNRRKKIKKGMHRTHITILKEYDEKIFDECREIWADLSRRTGWKQPLLKKRFDREWGQMLSCPGITILLAHDVQCGRIAGFYIVKVIGDTAYGDTIAVHTDMMNTYANDALRFTFLVLASRIPGIRQASAAIRSNLKGLEAFKQSIGFVPEAMPAYIKLRPGIDFLLRLINPEQLQRLKGNFDEESAG